MATAQEFVDAAHKIWKNHGIYLWGGNCEKTGNLKINTIRNMEQSAHDTARVLRHLADCYDAGYDMSASVACDCSGLVVGILRELKCIKPADDYRARDLQVMCKKITLNNLQTGDLVFNKETIATHVGIYTGFDMVIEAMGRDNGVVKRKLSQGKWVIGGRLPYFK